MFYTIYDAATKTKFFIAAMSLADEKPDAESATMYKIDLAPLDDDEKPELYNVPFLVDRTNGKTEFCMPVLTNAIISGRKGIYDFNQMPCHALAVATLYNNMLIAPHDEKFFDADFLDIMFQNWFVKHEANEKYIDNCRKITGALCEARGEKAADNLMLRLSNSAFLELLTAYKAGFQAARENKIPC